jgi:hypothetical protein
MAPPRPFQQQPSGGRSQKESVLDMEDTTVWIIANLDLEESVFSAFSTRLATLSPLRGTFRDIRDLGAKATSVPQAPLGLILFFRRRIDPGLPSVSPALAAIGRAAQTLERVQVKHALRRAVFVDCGEMPNAPLSDFNVLGQYFESLSDGLPLPEGALIAALDYDRDADGGIDADGARWWDTRSKVFVDHMRDHIAETLRLLNGGG